VIKTQGAGNWGLQIVAVPGEEVGPGHYRQIACIGVHTHPKLVIENNFQATMTGNGDS
jgi:hypothetical protein